MRLLDAELILSASDLTGYAACPHLTQLELAAAHDKRARPDRDDPLLDVLSRRGMEHEAQVLAELAKQGRVVEIEVDSRNRGGLDRAAAETVAAMQSGADFIYQATFLDGGHVGHADFLERVVAPSDLGDWSYEVSDAKLARSVKASAVLQLCDYSQQVARIQGRAPEHIHVYTGDGERHTLRLADFDAYHRALARRLDDALGSAVATTPVPVDHCSVCRWLDECDEYWRSSDDLSIVAGMRRDHAERLTAAGYPTTTALAGAPDGLAVPGIGTVALDRLQHQAALQMRGAGLARPLHERLPVGDGPPWLGLVGLPPPSPGDLFFDIEGDPYVGKDGLEYLFGLVELDVGQPRYTAYWGHDADGEKRAFERLIDHIVERRREFPDLHVYHYAFYEPPAVRKLMGRHATREAEVDDLLRNEVFVDLYRVVRHGVRLSTESYSLKAVETLYMDRPEGEVMGGGASIVAYERWLEEGDGQILDELETYNRDDCVSLVGLRDWLEQARVAAEAASGQPLARPQPDPGEPSAELRETDARLATLAAELEADVPRERDDRSHEQQARWLLAQLLQWHRREDKPQWWAYFRRVNELSVEELADDPDCIGGLGAPVEIGPDQRSTVYRYSFTPQDHKIRVGNKPHDPAQEKQAGEVIALGDDWIELKRGATLDAVAHPQALIPQGPIQNPTQRRSIEEIGCWVAEHGIDGPGPHQAVRDLLLCRGPRLRTGTTLDALRSEDSLTTACTVVGALEDGCLAIQGPPGSGKTWTGARMILTLLDAGHRVGITASSHSAISNLLDAVHDAATERGVEAHSVQRVDDAAKGAVSDGVEYGSNARVLEALSGGEVQLGAGTAWLWSRPEFVAAVDVLFVDEAGQMSLANVLAVSPAATNVVLLGDPQQLAQPSQGTHPDGAGASALEHLVGDNETMPAERGLFLDQTWRMHPSVTEFVSDVAYRGRLGSAPGRERINVDGIAGLRYEPVHHVGNRVRSAEEAQRVAQLVDELVGKRWTDDEGEEHVLRYDDMLVVAPYNAHVAEIKKYVPDAVPVGTVDKFQGREATVAIYSMASSSADDAPRGMTFLYDLHRMNVAVSRAKALAILVCSPELLRVSCRTADQMRLANALCRFVELAGER